MSKDGRKHAIVLSGGGAYGAYEVGVLKALLTGRSPTTGYEPLVPDIVTGTSVGAFNAAYLVSKLAAGGPAAAADLEKLWRGRIAQGPGQCSNGVYRIRMDPQDFLTPGCYLPNPLEPLIETARDAVYLASQTMIRTLSCLGSSGPPVERAIDELYIGALFDTEPFDKLIRDTIDFAAVRGSQVALKIFATNWSTSRYREFSNADLTDDLADRAVQASGSMPMLFPPVKIGDDLFVDGGLVINTPIAPAIDAGADVIHVIFLDPLVRHIPLREPISTAAEAYRFIAILFANQVRDQIVQIDLINRTLRMLADMARGVAPEAGENRTFLRVASLVNDHIAQKRPYKPLEIYAYRPSSDILRGMLGFLDFDLANLETLIDAGLADAIAHPAQPETGEGRQLKGFL